MIESKGYPLIKCEKLLTSLKTGPFGSALNSEHWSPNGTAVLTIGCLGEQSIIDDELLYISDSYAEKLNSYRVNEGDIVFSRVADIGRAQLISKKQDGWIISSNLMKMVINKKLIRPAFLYIAIKGSPVVVNQFKRQSNGNGCLLVNSSIVKNIKVPTPDLATQDRLIDIIGNWDNAIEKTEALIAAKEKQFEWLTSSLINRANHDRCSASKCMTEVSARNRSNGITRVLSVTNHSGFVLPEEQFERRVASSNVSNYKIVENGQYAYNPSRINVGSIARLDDWDNGILSPMYVVFKIDEARVCSDYFLHWLNSSEARQRIKNSAQGSVRETVSFKDLGAIDIPLPAINIQKDITDKLNIAQSEIALLKKTLEQYRLQKRGLMQKLLTGEWQVSTQDQTTEETRKELSKERIA